MRRGDRWFIAILALAAAFALAAGVYLRAERNEHALDVTVLAGDAGAVEGVSLAQEFIFSGHLLWDGLQDAANGESETESGFFFSRRRAGAPGYRPEIDLELGSLDAEVSAEGGFREPYESLYAAAEAAGGRLDVPASEYFDCLPVTLGGVNLNLDGVRADVSGVFRIPVPEGAMLRAESYTYGRVGGGSGRGLRLEQDFALDALEYESAGVLAPNGYYYLAFTVRDGSGETVEAAVPGGEWTLWRVKCDIDADTSAARWWAESDYSASLNPADIEPANGDGVYWDEAALYLSHDGEQVLLVTREGGGLWLNVLDAGSGGRIQRLSLGAAEGGMGAPEYRSGPDWAVFTFEDGRALCLENDAGRWSLGLALEQPEIPLPENKRLGGMLDFAYYNGRLITLRRAVSVGVTLGADGYVLCAAGESGLEYAAYFEDELTRLSCVYNTMYDWCGLELDVEGRT